MPAMPARRSAVGCRFRLRKALNAVDGALHLRIETLHAEAGAVDAAERQRLDHRVRDSVRGSISTAISAVRRDEEAMRGSARSGRRKIPVP